MGNSQDASGLSINDFQNIDAKLGPFQDNGGPTWTCALLPGSPAIGSGSSVGAPATDQRGVPRPSDNVDMGAFQVVTRIIPVVTWINPADIRVGTALGSSQLDASCATPGTFAYSPPAGTLLAAGSNQVLTAVFTPTDLIDFSPTTNSVTINVLKLNQAISFDPLPDQEQGNAPFLLTVTASSGLPVNLAVQSGPALVVNNLLSMTGPTGRVTVAASQAGNATYASAPSVTRSFDVVPPASARITQQPLSQVVADGDRVVLTVSAEGAPLKYQWQFQGKDISNATGPALTLSSVSQGDQGAYAVVVSNSGASTLSDVAILTVRPRLSIKQAGGQVSITWGFGVLQSSLDLLSWSDVPGANSPYSPAGTEAWRFYRVRE